MMTNRPLLGSSLMVLFSIVVQFSMICAKPSVVDLMKSDGYQVEIHKVMTEDGYVIELHRIPSERFANSSLAGGRKPVIFLGHCALCSSAAFVILGPTRGLAYTLANQGYDVWMINNRGTTYSRQHRTMSPESMEFWKFGLHEQGTYDVPASIDYILKETKEAQLDYLAFSMGTTQFLILMCNKPEYNEKIRSMIALAPAAYVNGSYGFVADTVIRFTPMIINWGLEAGFLELPPPFFNTQNLLTTFCNPQVPLFQELCLTILESFGARKNENMNMNLIPFFLDYFPESISMRSAVHYAQLAESGKFQNFNFGRRKNMRVYGETSPPDYDLSKITVPISIFWANGDSLTTPEDVKRLMKDLPNVVYEYQVPFTSFSHMDFIWGKNTHAVVYDKIIKRLKMPGTYTRMHKSNITSNFII